ncbi:phosphoadenylyl-sulfate reductase [Vibrio sp. 10N.261.52.C11]|uniref:phosphoadenylyl-sulfate reductase n=1 Tax=Vibrio sp. 10N.261.52.C11 TaxID=3229680 RepID=UPI00354D0AE7
MYSVLEINSFRRLNIERQTELLSEMNEYLSTLTASERVAWALNNIRGNQALTSSFGIQAAVCLHMYTSIKPDIPVILVDTGYLFDETYQFIESLRKKLGLNLKVFRSETSPAWQEAVYGKLWEQGVDGLKKYNRINKVVPMSEAFRMLDTTCWHSGLRREQADSRKKLSYLSVQGDQFKLLPILDWTSTDVEEYILQHNLEYHPLFYKGYVSMGDWHTTRPLEQGMKEEDTRFNGLFRECGLHEQNVIENVEEKIDMKKFFKE